MSALVGPTLLVACAVALAVIHGGTIPLAWVFATITFSMAWLCMARADGESWVWLLAWLVTVIVGLIVAVFAWPATESIRWEAMVSYNIHFAVYFGSAYLASRCSPNQVRCLLAGLVALGLFEAGYGLWALTTQNQSILGVWPRQIDTRFLSGTFINRNHVVDLLSASWLIGLALLSPVRIRALRWSLVVLLCLVLGFALFATQSRLGVVSFIVGISLFGVLVRRTKTTKGFRIVLIGALAMGLTAAIWFGLEGLIDRFLSLSAETGRIQVWRAVLAAPWQAWVFGVGPGQFEEAFKLIQPIALVGSYPEAHNEYLEFFFEFGLIGGTLVVSTFTWWVHRCRPRRMNVIQMAALSVVVTYAVHATADFGLQVPGAAIVFWIALGVLFNRNLELLDD